MAPPTIYRNVESVLSTLTNYKADNTKAVDSLLQVYNNKLKIYNEECSDGAKKHPLIILEGLDGSGKSTVGKKLASKLKAAKWCTPPESIKSIRPLFDNHNALRTAYYALGNYIAALEAAVVLKTQPVVMDRYWHSTAAFAIAQAVHDFPGEVEIPPEGDSFYHWPQDLLKPDAVIFLNVSENVRLQRLSRRTESTSQEELLKTSTLFRENNGIAMNTALLQCGCYKTVGIKKRRVIESQGNGRKDRVSIFLAYRNMVNPKVTFVNANGHFKMVLQEIDSKINPIIQNFAS